MDIEYLTDYKKKYYLNNFSKWVLTERELQGIINLNDYQFEQLLSHNIPFQVVSGEKLFNIKDLYSWLDDKKIEKVVKKNRKNLF